MPTYPLSNPTTPAYRTATWGFRRRTGVSESPFTGKQQVYEYTYGLWFATLSLPPMKRDQASAWEAFFMKLRGRRGTFLLENPDYSFRGAVNTAATLNTSAAVGDETVQINTGNNSTTDAFVAGDMIQLGAGATAKLYMITDNATTNASGVTDVNIEPAIKTAAASGATVEYTSPKGVFRLDAAEVSWETNEVSVYGFTFSCSEAL